MQAEVQFAFSVVRYPSPHTEHYEEFSLYVMVAPK